MDNHQVCLQPLSPFFFIFFQIFFFTCLTFFFSHGLKSRYNGIKSVISGRDGCESTFFLFHRVICSFTK